MGWPERIMAMGWMSQAHAMADDGWMMLSEVAGAEGNQGGATEALA